MAVDDLGHSLASAEPPSENRQQPYSQGPLRASPMPIVLRLQQPAEPGHKITRLEGTISVWTGANPLKKITITTLKNSTQPWAGGLLRVNTIRKTADKTYQVDMSADEDPRQTRQARSGHWTPRSADPLSTAPRRKSLMMRAHR